MDQGYLRYESIEGGSLEINIMDYYEVNPINHGFGNDKGRPLGKAHAHEPWCSYSKQQAT